MKFFSFILLFLFTATQAFAGAAIDGCSNVYSQLVFDAKTQNILSETRAGKIAYPASLTKLMTLYLTFQALKAGKIKLDDEIIVSQRGEEISAINRNTTLHLKEGNKITVEQAIKGSIVKSFNEASVSLAEAVAGDEWNFVRKMNEKAFELGMFNTSFRNSTGFHEDGQYTTAYDLARLTIALRRDFPQYYPLFALRTFEYKGRKFETHNHVLLEYKGAEGMKTGYTRASGFNLISVAAKPFDRKSARHITNNQKSQEMEDRVISIVMGCSSVKSRDNFTKKLLNQGFDNIRSFEKNSIVSKINSGFDYEEKKVVKLGNEMEKLDVVGEGLENEAGKGEVGVEKTEVKAGKSEVEVEKSEVKAGKSQLDGGEKNEVEKFEVEDENLKVESGEGEFGKGIGGEKVAVEKVKIFNKKSKLENKEFKFEGGKLELGVEKLELENEKSKLEIKKSKSEAKKSKSETKKSKPEIKKSKSENKKSKPEAKKSKAGNKKSKAKKKEEKAKTKRAIS